MIRFTASRDPGVAELALAKLVRTRLDPLTFRNRSGGLRRMSSAFTACSPPPWPAPGLRITAEISYQSEHWLPLEQLRSHFYALYRHSLTYRPIYSSSPFATAASWAELVSGFPSFLLGCAVPAQLFEHLLTDADLRRKFLFWSFMPRRFYGSGSDRYPGQSGMIRDWIRSRSPAKPLRCLDAACGDGANTYRLAQLLKEQGRMPESFEVEGWTLDPLEVWSAAHGCFPHDPAREAAFRAETADCFGTAGAVPIRFSSVDLLEPADGGLFDLILCNGLLGGPIINVRREMDCVVGNLARLLAPGGLLLAADHFHGGWKQKCPQQELRAFLLSHGLAIVEATEGSAGLALQPGNC